MERIGCLFIGGSTRWSWDARQRLVRRGEKRGGSWIDSGRCNTRRRFRHAIDVG